MAQRQLLLVILGLLFITGCSRDNLATQSDADILSERAADSMQSGNFQNAIAYYEMLEARYPFSNPARQAQLNLIYAYYMNGDNAAAIDAADNFERENPTHPRVDYALYMRGLAHFKGQHNRFHRLFRIDLAKRPPVEAEESFSAFSQLVQRFPESRYAPDARQRMIFLRNRLAEHENYVARYYMKRGGYIAALNRARYSVENYDGAPAVEESLVIMVEAYKRLGMEDLAETATLVLAENYPDAVLPKPKRRKRWIIF